MANIAKYYQNNFMTQSSICIIMMYTCIVFFILKSINH